MEPSSLEPSQRLTQALHLAETGANQAAETQLRQLIAEGLRQPQAAMALGVLCGERGDLSQRRLWLHQARRLEEASGEASTLRLLLNLLVDALEQGDLEQAEIYGRKALDLYPSDGEAHLQLSRVVLSQGHQERGRAHLEMACTALRAQLAENPQEARLWRLLATGEQNAERIDDAIEAYLQGLALDPNHLPSLMTLGQLLVGRGRGDEAMPWLLNALAIAPEDPDVLSLNGLALRSIGEIQQAAGVFRTVLEINPERIETRLLLGGCLNDLGLFAEAEALFREGLERSPGHQECLTGQAGCLRALGDARGAIAIYTALLEEMPEAQGVFNNLMFAYSTTALATPAEVLTLARNFWERQGVVDGAPWPKPLRVVDRPLRVGLLSADIGSHVVGRFLDPLLRHHDRGRCQLELISMHRRYEATSEELIGLADGFHSLEGLPRDQARALMRQQEYDLIVDTSGYTRGTGLHLLAERCAPVQAHYIGYHATTGLETIDWFIGDEETAAPELQPQFNERLYRLPGPWLAYPKDSPFPEATPLMQTERPVLGSFSQVAKISELTLEFWGAVLRSVPEALLVLKSPGFHDEEVRNRLERALANKGVAPNRICFLAPVQEWLDHVDHYNVLDIALDTTPWSGATTAFEALGMGVPLITIRGNCMAARMSSSVIKSYGKHEWIASNPERACEIASGLCKDLKKLRARKRIAQQEALNSILYDGVAQCEKLMDAFDEICKM